MPRGDKNKRGSAGRPGSGQSNQPFAGSDKDSKSDHNRNQTGTWPSAAQEKRLDSESHRNRSTDPQETTKAFRGEERRFNLLVDNVPYMVQAIPFRFNGELRYRVSYNGSPEYVFTWDSALGQLRAIDDDSSTMPDNLELAISGKLQSQK